MLLYIIRHGEPDPSTGALTRKGLRQAEAVGKLVSHMRINRIYSSPLLRAKQTAEPACNLLHLPMQIEEWTHEIGPERNTYFPDGVKKSVSAVQNTHYRENGNIHLPYEKAYECDYFKQSDMKKAVSYIEEEGNLFLEKLGYKEENGVYRILENNEDNVALFCHAAFARAWISVLLHIPIHIMWSGFDYMHTGVTVLEFKNNEDGFTAPTCLCYSDTSHLYADCQNIMLHEKWEL